MRNIHITFLGGQPAPVFYGIREANPDIVEILYSRDTENSLTTIKELLKTNNVGSFCEESAPLDPWNPKDIRQRVEELKNKYREDAVSINISSGTKPWNYFFIKGFEEHPDVKFTYVDQSNRLWDYSDFSYRQFEPLALERHLELYGNPMIEYYRLSDYTADDEKMAMQIEAARQYNYADFNKLAAVLDEKQKKILKSQRVGKWSCPDSPSYVEWDKGRQGETRPWVRLVLYKKDKRCREFFFESEHVINLVFNSGWFEYKVAKLLSSWPMAKDILLNCRFKTRKNIDKNEADIIIQTAHRLLFIECKTQLHRTVDIDKFSSVVKSYGGSASLGIFVTEEKMSDPGKDKCNERHLLTPFALSEEHHGIPAGLALQMLLNQALQQSNQ